MWTLLKAPGDWEEHKVEMAKVMQISPSRVSWGSGPVTYPCLATTLIPSRLPDSPQGSRHEIRAHTAYVYEADCEVLFKACGRRFVSEDAAPAPQSQASFNRWVAAELLTLSHYMVETGLCAPHGGVPANKEAFENKLAEFIVMVDQYHGERKAEIRANLSPTSITVLDTLEPPK